MAETTARTFVIAALIMTAVITGSFTLIAGSIPENVGNYSDYNRTFSQFDAMKNRTDSIASKIEIPDKVDTGSEGILTGFLDVSVGAVQQIWDSVKIIKQLLVDLTQGAGGYSLPSWFTYMFISIILTTVAFALMSAWFKWRI